jgi:hypothetical protein
MSMNINALPGDRVRFAHPDNGYIPDQEKAARHLKVGNVYTVSRTSVHAFYTNVYLNEVFGVAFNSVMFEDAVERMDARYLGI